MDKILVLAEKPSVGRDIAKVLNCNKKGNGYLEGDKHIVTWALGHLVTLAEPEDYDPKYKSWRIEDLPMLPSPLNLVVIGQSSKQYRVVRDQMKRTDVREIILATDAGREGELVGRWIIKKAHINKPIKRLWISSVTDKAIREGFNKLRNGKDYENLYAAAVARAEADWLIGINATRALTCKYNAQLSCGRVQTPTLAIVAQREEEIRSFKARVYYGIIAVTKGLTLTWQDSKTKEARIFEKNKCDHIIQTINNKNCEVIEVNKSLKKQISPQLYDLTELQREANRQLGYSAKETLTILQRLYEQHKILTYPRTDSRYISTDIVDTIQDRLKACSVGPYLGLAGKVIKRSVKANKSFVDNSKVSDHHAIIPTEEAVSLGILNEKERKIYDLVVKRFLAVLYPPFEYEEIKIEAKIGTETFTARGKTILASGWKEIYANYYENEDTEDIAEQSIPQIQKGDVLRVLKLSLTKGETKPPNFFSEATLLSAMEKPTKYMENEHIGLGTVATRADIIEKLFNNFLLERKGKYIQITSKGKQLLELVPDEIKSPALTAQWEQKLDSISQGTLEKEQYINEIRDYAKVVVNEIKDSQKRYNHDNLTGNKCPQCGKYLLEVNGKKGKILVCSDRECGYRKGLSKTTNARCPNCHKKLELRGEGEGQIFLCKCGYREKLTAFEERQKKEKSNVSKKDVTKYLKTQNEDKEGLTNHALADALTKLNLKD